MINNVLEGPNSMPTCNKTTHGTVMAAATWRVEGFNHPETAEGFALYKAMH